MKPKPVFPLVLQGWWTNWLPPPFSTVGVWVVAAAAADDMRFSRVRLCATP